MIQFIDYFISDNINIIIGTAIYLNKINDKLITVFYILK